MPENNKTQPPAVDYANSNRLKAGKVRPAETETTALTKPEARTEIVTTEPKAENQLTGFFKATLKDAIQNSIKTVIDPMIRNFIDATISSITNSLLWGGDSRGRYGTGRTDYKQISTGGVPWRERGGNAALDYQDKVRQDYEKLSVNTLQEANKIMGALYRTLRMNGQVTLANYYELFGESTTFTDEYYGWTQLPEAAVYAKGGPDGYHIIMPPLRKLVSELRR